MPPSYGPQRASPSEDLTRAIRACIRTARLNKRLANLYSQAQSGKTQAATDQSVERHKDEIQRAAGPYWNSKIVAEPRIQI